MMMLGATHLPYRPVSDPYWANVRLLLNFESSYTDLSAIGHTMTAAAATAITTDIKKYGEQAVDFSAAATHAGLRSSIVAADSLTAEFTIEMWYYPQANISSAVLFGTDGTGGYIAHTYGSSGAKLCYLEGGTERCVTTASLTENTWYHVALTRDSSNVCRLFLNGVVSAATYTHTDAFFGAQWFISGTYDGGVLYATSSVMDDIRVTKGVARYTSNFTPPITTLPTS